MAEEMSFEELQGIVSLCLDEIMAVKGENENLRRQIDNLTAVNLELGNHIRKLYEDYEETKQNIAASLKIQDMGLDNMVYELNDPHMDTKSIYYPTFYEIEYTIDKIIHERCSMARFGDGELAIMAHRSRQKFQPYDAGLAERLRTIINVNEERFLIAIADNYGSLAKYSRAGKSGIRSYMTEEVRLEHRAFLDLQRVYHNAYISRPCVLYADFDTKEPGKRFERLKEIWKGREVIIVEGSQSRLGVGNDLFDNVAQLCRVEAPPENAYEKYDAILSAALSCGKEGCLYLIALGPTAGVLAYDLFREGYQALDIGHIDLEYEWYLHGGGKRCEVKGKYNNEYTGGELVEDIEDADYLAQIAATIF